MAPAAPAAAMKRPAGAAMRRPAGAAVGRERSRSAPPPAVVPARPLEGLTALLLGLERRQDRRQRCEEMLAREAPWLPCSFFRATDGREDRIPDEEVAPTWNTRCNALYGAYEDVADKDGGVVHTAAQFADPGVDYKFSPGERGCAHSHYRMWQQVASGSQPVLILEDDVQLVFQRTIGGMSNGATFTQRLEIGMQEASKQKADVLYLGWSGFRDGNFKHLKAARGKKSLVVRRAEYVWTTVAYVLWPAGARKLLDRARPMNQPVDNFMAWEAREGRLNALVLLDEGDTDETWAGGIVTQLDFNGDSDIKKSDGGDQGDDPTEFLAARSGA